MEENDSKEFYDQYAHIVSARIGYPTRAVYKSLVAWRVYRDILIKECGDIKRVADIGGCYGFGLNAFIFHGQRILGHKIHGDLFELSESYCNIGKLLFPDLNFRIEDFNTAIIDSPYDITLMFDFLEHVDDPRLFLNSAMMKSRFLIIKTPLETTNIQKKRIADGLEPPIKSGVDHPDGHVHFFTLPDITDIVKETFDVIKAWVWYERLPQINDFMNPEVAVFESKKKSILKEILGIPLEMMKVCDPRPMIYRSRIYKGDGEGAAFILAKSKKY